MTSRNFRVKLTPPPPYVDHTSRIHQVANLTQLMKRFETSRYSTSVDCSTPVDWQRRSSFSKCVTRRQHGTTNVRSAVGQRRWQPLSTTSNCIELLQKKRLF